MNNKIGESTATTGKEPWLATNFSRLLPGLGQLYNGQSIKGWLFIVSYLAIAVFGFWSIFADAGNAAIGFGCIPNLAH